MSIKSVVQLGADGNIGPSVYKALKDNDFDITVLKRKSSRSKSKYPKEAFVSDAFEVEELVEVLKGHDAVVITINGNQVDIQKRIADAAVRAGIKRLIPADFGSVDSSSPLTQDLVPLYRNKSALREYLISLTKSHPTFTWTSLVCGHFFDWSLEFLHIWYPTRSMDILDSGETKWSASSFAQVALATVRILQRPEITANRMIYVQSFCISQKEVLAAFERVTGEKWGINRLDSKEYKNERVKKRDEGSKEAIEDLVWLLGAIDANWEGRKDFAMEELGLENEDLDVVVRNVVEGLEREKKEAV
ncbi:hypothetical protein CKM354_000811400 [Cercospora kikuchii]|uniref:NmrA-like domain-containing protein n=1 Tax=Cercospora kikuchii TaxID=84275 RepID=A0A9P3CQT2_9PEZI|nr:uncharacterized protein CKM354_000811400 [Cercospora kikuchii]GIZ44930.1 hypothetical protein CKM354_000811400 [Cercospora kikuchii]